MILRPALLLLLAIALPMEEVMGREIHVKDAHLPGGWGFFSFASPTTAKLTPRPASCYTCHEEHTAVDTTFAQFYPTLIG